MMTVLSLQCVLGLFAGLGPTVTAMQPLSWEPRLAAVSPQEVPAAGLGRGGRPPSGGTPEPASILLLVGGALGYGAYRLKRSKERPPVDR